MKKYKNNTEKIDYIVAKISEMNKEIYPEDIVRSLIFEPEIMENLVLDDELKDLVLSISKEDMVKEVASYALRVSQADVKIGYIAERYKCINFFSKILYAKIKPREITEFLLDNDELIESVINSYVKSRYVYRNQIDMEKLDNFSNIKIAKYLEYLTSKKKITTSLKIMGLKIYEKNVNKCRKDILTGMQLRKDCVNYSLGTNMFASSHIGNFKSTQEDSVLLLTHPKNSNFKLLVVADGLGKNKNAGEASKYVAQMMLKWFENLDKKYYQGNNKGLIREFEKKLIRVNEKLCEFKDGRKTTFVGAIVSKNKTIIASAGDARAYISKDGILTQMSRDDTLAQDYLEEGYITDKNDARFHNDANKITKCLGITEPFSPNMYVLDNKSYDKLLLVSGGVSDCLSDDQIMAITSNTPREQIAKKLIEKAVTEDSYREECYNPIDFKDRIDAGKTNVTAAVFSKK